MRSRYAAFFFFFSVSASRRQSSEVWRCGGVHVRARGLRVLLLCLAYSIVMDRHNCLHRTGTLRRVRAADCPLCCLLLATHTDRPEPADLLAPFAPLHQPAATLRRRHQILRDTASDSLVAPPCPPPESSVRPTATSLSRRTTTPPTSTTMDTIREIWRQLKGLLMLTMTPVRNCMLLASHQQCPHSLCHASVSLCASDCAPDCAVPCRIAFSAKAAHWESDYQWHAPSAERIRQRFVVKPGRDEQRKRGKEATAERATVQPGAALHAQANLTLLLFL